MKILTTSATSDGVFFEAFEVQYRYADAVANVNNENDAIISHRGRMLHLMRQIHLVLMIIKLYLK